jgi:hypothetical protein
MGTTAADLSLTGGDLYKATAEGKTRAAPAAISHREIYHFAGTNPASV